MKILIYSLGLPPFRRGGLVNYTVDLATQLVRNGNTVDLLYPGEMSIFRNNKKIKFSRKKADYSFNCYELINPLPVSLTFGNSVNPSKFYDYRDKDTIRKFIKKISPDVVHFHTIMGLPIEFLEVLKENKIKTVYTTHDYYGLCPKMLESNPKESLRTSKCSYDCMLCKPGPGYKKIWLMQSHFYQKLKNTFVFNQIRNHQREKISSNNVEYIFNDEQIKERYQLRQYYLKLFTYFDYFHFNSTVTKNIFQKYLPNIKGKVIPLIIKGLPDNYIKNEPSKHESTIGFLGGIHEKKGFNLLKTTTDKISKNFSNFTVICGGSNSDNSYFENYYVKNMGIIPRKEIEEFYRKIDLLVVPSQWHETFGLVVLEAVSRHIPVICSNNVGSKDILPSDFVFNNSSEFFEMLNDYVKSFSKRSKYFKEAQEIKIDTNFKNHTLRIQEEFY